MSWNDFSIKAGDFTFDLEGSLLKKAITFLKNQNNLQKEYEDIACDMMSKHYAFYGELSKVGIVKEEEYVTREAVIHCDKGSKDVKLDAYEDHGILAANGKPLMTCNDCEVNKNIYSFGTCKCGDIYSESLPHPSEEGEPDEHGNVRYKCMPVLCGKWKQKAGNLLIAQGEEFVEALRSGAFLTCIYEGKITVIGIPEKESDNEYIIVDNWLYLYTKPTVEGTGRSVNKHPEANNYDWAMPEDLSDNYSENWFETESPAHDEIEENDGDFEIDKVCNNVYIDSEGRYWVGLGPNVVNPNHDKQQVDYDIRRSEMNYGTKLDIVVQDKKGNVYYIRAVVGDAKEHSYPDGIFQTGIPFNRNRKSFPESKGNTVEFIGYNISETLIDGQRKSSINVTNNYLLVKIIVYDGVFNYEQS